MCIVKEQMRNKKLNIKYTNKAYEKYKTNNLPFAIYIFMSKGKFRHHVAGIPL